MSQHLDAVATSTLHLKQSRHHLKRRKLSRQQVHKRRGRNNIRMSRKQLYREVVATTLGCRDINCTEKLSRQHQDVATTIVWRRCRDNIRLSRQQLQGPECRDVDKLSRREQVVTTPPSLKTCINNTETPATRTATRPTTRTDVATRALYVVTISVYWASLLKSKKKCIEIRAQLQSPINMQLQKKKRSWVAT